MCVPEMFKPAKKLLDSSKAVHSLTTCKGLPYSASRYFSVSRQRHVDTRTLGKADADAHATTFDDAIAQEQGKQARAPWHREGSEQPPVKRQRSASAMTKGKLLTTPSRLLKLIIPLTTADHNTDRKSVQPLALLVHPQQPLSYLERLIQSELPVVTTKDKQQKIPAVHFKAEDFATDEIKPEQNKDVDEDEEQGDDAVSFDGKIERTGKITSEDEEAKYEKKKEAALGEEDADGNNSSKLSPEDKGESGSANARQNTAHELRGGPGEGGVEYYSGAGREAEADSDHSHRFVRWSSSTEIGDFIRDAARGKEFAVEIEGAKEEIRVGVPSFNDRTHYLRTRLRKMSRRIAQMAHIKTECDKLAHKSAQWVAISGFGAMVGWWGLVYYLTFQTDLGWDVMEPVTYLVGLSTVICGALWFLYHNREVSYRSALSLTVSRRQNQLYHAKGFDLAKWEALVQEANSLRSEIKNVANEYDVDWDERADEHDETVAKALKQDREARKSKKEEAEEKEEEKE